MNNAVSSGVKKAKNTTKKALDSLNKDAKKAFGPIKDELKDLVKNGEKKLDNLIDNNKVQSAIDEAKKELDKVVDEINQDFNDAKEEVELAQTETTETTETPVEVVEIIEEPVEVVLIAEQFAAIEEKPILKQAPVEEEIDYFSIEEKEVMKTLAEQGRLFDDVDEAKMVKLTEDLTAWINKYAPTFGDQEAILFEVAESLMIE